MERIEKAGILLIITNSLLLIIVFLIYLEVGLTVEFSYVIGLICWFLQTIAFYFLATASEKSGKIVNKAIEKMERRKG